MYIVNSYFTAVVLSMVTMLCWGSWANTQKMASKNWAYQLFYRDYVVGVLFFSIIWAFTFGSIGKEGQGFIENLGQAATLMLFYAFAGGVIFNLANLLLVAAIDKVGLAIAFPVAIGISCSLGTIINYIAQPEGTQILFLLIGIGFFLAAVVINSLAYMKLQKTAKEKSKSGIIISILSGLLMGIFYYAVAKSITSTFTLIDPGKLSPYTAVVIFSFGVFASDFIWNSNFMTRLKLWNHIDYSQYFKGKPRWHLVGISGGVLWSIGMCFSIISGCKAGYAISFGLGNGATMIAALWGVLVWKEFKNASKGTLLMLGGMFMFFTAAIIAIIISKS